MVGWNMIVSMKLSLYYVQDFCVGKWHYSGLRLAKFFENKKLLDHFTTLKILNARFNSNIDIC